MGRRPATKSGSPMGVAVSASAVTGGAGGTSPADLVVRGVRSGLARLRNIVPDDLDGLAVATPPARHVLDRFLQDLDVLDRELPAYGEVVEGPCAPAGHDIEPRSGSHRPRSGTGSLRGWTRVRGRRRPGPARAASRRSLRLR